MIYILYGITTLKELIFELRMFPKPKTRIKRINYL
jgi:hypothetical protein